MRFHRGLIVATLLAGCGTLPRDVDDTSDRIAKSHVIRVGVAGRPGVEAQRFLARLSAETRAAITIVPGSLEPLLDQLDKDAIELVVAPVRADSELADAVALTPPLDGSAEGDRPVQWRAASRNGENRWIMTVERVARAAAGR